MSRRRISQREARAAIKRVKALETMIERERRSWAPEIPGERLGRVTWDAPSIVCEAARVARMLGFTVVGVPNDGARELLLYAVPRETF